MVRRALIFYFIISAIGLILCFSFDLRPISYLPTRDGVLPWGFQPLFGLGVGFLVAGLGLLISKLTRLGSDFDDMLENLFSEINHYDAITLAIASGIAEEWLFRSVGVPLIGVWSSSILFALLHIPPKKEFIFWPVLAFGLGLGFAFWTEKTDSVMGPTIAHIVINAVALYRIVPTASKDS